LHEFFDRVGRALRNRRGRASFAMCAMGLLGEGERKSMEPIAARARAAPDEVDGVHLRWALLDRFGMERPGRASRSATYAEALECVERNRLYGRGLGSASKGSARRKKPAARLSPTPRGLSRNRIVPERLRYLMTVLPT
jgi:hypothetical protein